MAKKPARVLVDIPSVGARADDLLQASAQVIAALPAEGQVDPHRDAVAHARALGARVVDWPSE